MVFHRERLLVLWESPNVEVAEARGVFDDQPPWLTMPTRPVTAAIAGGPSTHSLSAAGTRRAVHPEVGMILRRMLNATGVGLLGVLLFVSASSASNHALIPLGTTATDSTAPNPTGRTLILVVDTSGSMDDNDPHGLCRDACQIIAGMAEEGDNIGVVCFDSGARVAVPLQRVTDTNRSQIHELIELGFSRTGQKTDFAAGLELANEMRAYMAGVEAQLVGSAEAGAHLILFMSDGEHNVPTRSSYDDVVVPVLSPFEGGEWPVHAVCFSRSSRGNGRRDLQDMAERTAGAFFLAQDAGVLFERFQELARSFWGLMSIRDVPSAALLADVATLHCLGQRDRRKPSIGELSRNGTPLDSDIVRKYPDGTSGRRSSFDLWSVDAPEPGVYTAEEINGGRVISIMARPEFQWVIDECRTRPNEIELIMRVEGDNSILRELQESGQVRTRLIPFERGITENQVQWVDQQCSTRLDEEGKLFYEWTLGDVEVDSGRLEESFRLDVNYEFRFAQDQAWDLGSRHRTVTMRRQRHTARFTLPLEIVEISPIGAMGIDLEVVEQLPGGGARPAKHELLPEQVRVDIADEDTGEHLASLMLRLSEAGGEFVGSFSSDGYDGVVLPGAYRLTADLVLGDGQVVSASRDCLVAGWPELSTRDLQLAVHTNGQPIAGEILSVSVDLLDRDGQQISIGDEAVKHWRPTSAEFRLQRMDALGSSDTHEANVADIGMQVSTVVPMLVRCSGDCEMRGNADVCFSIFDESGRVVFSDTVTLDSSKLELDVAPRVSLDPPVWESDITLDAIVSREAAFTVEGWFGADTTLAIWMEPVVGTGTGEYPLPRAWFDSPGLVDVPAVDVDGNAIAPGYGSFTSTVASPLHEEGLPREGTYRGVVSVGEAGVGLASAEVVLAVFAAWPSMTDFEVVCVPAIPAVLPSGSDIVIWENELPGGGDLPPNHHVAQLRYRPRDQVLIEGSTVGERYIVKELVWDWPEDTFVRHAAEGVSPQLWHAMASFWSEGEVAFQIGIEKLVLALEHDETVTRTYTGVHKPVLIAVE